MPNVDKATSDVWHVCRSVQRCPSICPLQDIVHNTVGTDGPQVASHGAVRVFEAHLLPVARELQWRRWEVVALGCEVRAPCDVVEHGEIAHDTGGGGYWRRHVDDDTALIVVVISETADDLSITTTVNNIASTIACDDLDNVSAEVL